MLIITQNTKFFALKPTVIFVPSTSDLNIDTYNTIKNSIHFGFSQGKSLNKSY